MNSSLLFSLVKVSDLYSTKSVSHLLSKALLATCGLLLLHNQAITAVSIARSNAARQKHIVLVGVGQPLINHASMHASVCRRGHLP